MLARAIDDSTFNVLNSSIIFNQIDIITHVQNDQAFLREIAGMFMDDDLLALLGLAAKPTDALKDPTPDGAKDSDKMDVDQPDAKPNGAAHPNGRGGSGASRPAAMRSESRESSERPEEGGDVDVEAPAEAGEEEKAEGRFGEESWPAGEA